MSKFQQEWQTGNSLIGFPFSSEESGQVLPDDFIVDLRLFLTGTKIVEAFLGTVAYNHVTDAYTLTFAKKQGGATVLQGTVSRLDASGGSKVGFKQVISDNEKVCLFVPGNSWHTPEWGGVDSWTLSYTSTEAEISSDVVNPGPSTFRRIFVEGHVPDESLWPRGGIQTVIGGYNINLGVGGGRSIISIPGAIDLSAIGGAGAGYPPKEDPVIDYVATFNGEGPDSKGNMQFDTVDCLRVFQPMTESELPVPNTIQVVSDCMPCCTCEEYRNTSRAIGRRSAKVKDLCDRLQQLITDSATAYNIGVAAINKNRDPLAVVRSIRAGGSTIDFAVQNVAGIPIFAYVAIRIEASDYVLGSMTVSQSNVAVVSGGGGDVHAAVISHRASLPSMPYDVSENALAGIPATKFSPSPAFLLCVGEKRSGGGFFPISSGGLIAVRLSFPSIAAAIVGATTPAGSVAAAHPLISFSSLAVYGASKAFACAADFYRIKIIDNDLPPDEFEECDLPFANDFRTIQA